MAEPNAKQGYLLKACVNVDEGQDAQKACPAPLLADLLVVDGSTNTTVTLFAGYEGAPDMGRPE